MRWVQSIKPFVPSIVKSKIRPLLHPLPDLAWQQRKILQLWRTAGFKSSLDVVAVDASQITLSGWAITSPKERSRLSFTCNGKPCDDVRYPLSRPDVAKVFPHIPGSEESGFVCSVHLAPENDPRLDELALRCLDRSTGQSLGGGDRPMYNVRRREDEPLPEGDRIFRVAGFTSPEFFYLQGYNLFRQLDYALRQTMGRGLSEFPQVLDWGCGCGRVAQHFRRLPSVQFTGADVDADNIGWCQKNLTFGRFLTVPLHPPMEFAADSFDLIIGLSVFTHLREEVAFEWLTELRRVAKKGAILLLSFHGNTALALRGTFIPFEQFKTLLRDGILDLAYAGYDAKLDEPATEYYRNMMHQDFYIKRHWAKYFEIIKILPSGVGMQELAVLRKR